MDFALSPEQDAYREAVVAFARTLNADVAARDSTHDFSETAWRRCAEFGIQGLPVAMDYGGQGADPVTIALAMEALGYGCTDNGLLFSLGAHMWSCVTPIAHFGSDEQKQRYLPGLVDGSLVGVQAMTEPDSGSDAFSLQTRATADGDGFRLRGTKTYITNAPIADVFVVFATTEPGQSLSGLCAFIVERETSGLEIGAPFRKMGLRTSPMSELVFDDCWVPGSAVLGRLGAGMAIFNSSMDWERSLIMATSLGTMQRQLDVTVQHARNRRQFGQPIGKFQAVANRLVDMRVRLDAARLLLYQLAWMKAQGKRTTAEAAIVKLVVSEGFLQSSLDALHVHGALGFMEEAGLERDVRDAIGSRIYSGTSDMQRNIVARAMGL